MKFNKIYIQERILFAIIFLFFHVYVKCISEGDYLKDSLGNKVTELKVIDCYFTALYERVSNFA